MFFLNLTLAEFLAITGILSGVVVGLYLLDRARRRVAVATLRFWKTSPAPMATRHRRRIQEPWSLVLQLAGLLLLAAALAQLRLGSKDDAARDNVLIVDTSAWMAARGRQSTLMAEAQGQALAWLRSLPSSDRVMVVRADALATPATVFESNRKTLEDAVRQSQPGHSALHLDRAFAFARQAQNLHARRPGEIVFAGSSRIAEREPVTAPANARLLAAPVDVDNVGLRKVAVRRAAADPDLWEAFVTARNYGAQPRSVPVVLSFGGAPAGSARLVIKPGAEASARFEYRTRAAGWLEARLVVRDALAGDDRAVVEIPAQETLQVAVYSPEPEIFRPLFAGNPRVEVFFERPEAYDPARRVHVVLFDRFRPPQRPVWPAIFIEPPDGAGTQVADASIARWHTDHPLAAGLKTRDVRLESARVLDRGPNDAAIAEVEQGPVIVARPAKPPSVSFGFHPLRSAMRFELATPLLFANILRWMSPALFRRWEIDAGSVGSVTTTLDTDWDLSRVKVIDAGNRPLPFTLRGNVLRFFAGAPGDVRVAAGERERVFSLTLPDLGEAIWEAPQTVRRGIPRRTERDAASRDLWQLLAILGAALLLAEWIWFGRSRLGRVRAVTVESASPPVAVKKAS